ncbi:MAG: MFS transporter [Ignavibacteria bacterium]|nr:MFS transporter [Ignavibacteria bacterium]
MKKLILPLSLGIAHGISDCSAGMLLGSLADSISIYGIGTLVLIYNLIAFGGQPLAGILTDKLHNPKFAAIIGLGLMSGALLLSTFNPMLSVILAGVASALFHVGGGALALCSTPDKASGPGLFSAPGVAGLAIGGYMAINGINALITLIVLLIIIGVVIYLLPSLDLPYNNSKVETDIDKHDLIMLILLMAIALRSAVWNVFQYIEQGDMKNIILISVAAASGKVYGGFLADRTGWRRYSLIALGLSIPLLITGKENLFLLLPGISLLQSVTPVLAASVVKTIPRMPATSAGLAFGLAIAVGGLPFIAGIDLSILGSPLLLFSAIILTVLILWFAMKKIVLFPKKLN